MPCDNITTSFYFEQYKVLIQTLADCGLRIADCGLRIADCGLRIAD